MSGGATIAKEGMQTVPLEISNVSMEYLTSGGESLLALDNIHLEVPERSFVSIVGPSGCGKTTLLEICAQLRAPTSGEVLLDGVPLRQAGDTSKIGIVFQEDTLFPWRDVISNVGFGLQMKGVDRKARTRRAREMLDIMGLSGFEHSLISELSGGMRQRVALARTLVLQPQLLLLDEPFGALDAQTRLILGTELSALCDAQETTVVLITHSVEEASMLSDLIVVVSARPGRVKALIPAGLPEPRGMHSLGTSDLAKIERRVWDSLRDEVSAVGRPAPSLAQRIPRDEE